MSELGVSPNNILCVTFTNKAANEMKKRIRFIFKDMFVPKNVCTFDSFCVSVLREEINFLKFPKNFLIWDEEDQKYVFKKILEDLNLTLKDFTYKEIEDYILRKK